ncbi:MAG: GNAT family N-acyltransferase [Paracoccaceae bacterium]
MISAGPYRFLEAVGPDDLARVQSLRARVFRHGRDGASGSADADDHDQRCQHFLIEHGGNGTALAAFRMMILPGAEALPQSYSAAYYDLAPLAQLSGPMAELGRFCLAPGLQDPFLLRFAWAAIARQALAANVGFLFGCSSFAGAEPLSHAVGLNYLWRHHLGPATLRPKALQPVALPEGGVEETAPLPPLLRFYLALGGWVGEGAVADPDLDTLHVFTGLHLADIPPARRKSLLALVSPGG